MQRITVDNNSIIIVRDGQSLAIYPMLHDNGIVREMTSDKDTIITTSDVKTLTICDSKMYHRPAHVAVGIINSAYAAQMTLLQPGEAVRSKRPGWNTGQILCWDGTNLWTNESPTAGWLDDKPTILTDVKHEQGQFIVSGKVHKPQSRSLTSIQIVTDLPAACDISVKRELLICSAKPHGTFVYWYLADKDILCSIGFATLTGARLETLSVERQYISENGLERKATCIYESAPRAALLNVIQQFCKEHTTKLPVDGKVYATPKALVMINNDNHVAIIRPNGSIIRYTAKRETGTVTSLTDKPMTMTLKEDGNVKQLYADILTLF